MKGGIDIKYLCLLILFISLFFIIYTFSDYGKEKIIQKKIEDYLKCKVKQDQDLSLFDKIEKFIVGNGNPLNLDVGGYILVKFSISILLFTITIFKKNIIISLILLVVGFFLIDIIYLINNYTDNAKIKMELPDLYDLIDIQVSAGVFLGNVLVESYIVVENRRLKKALEEMAAEINLTKNIENSLTNFNKKFKSIDIDCFVTGIKQSQIKMSTEMIEELSKSIKEENLVSIDQKNDNIENKIILIQVLIYIGVIMVVLFTLFTELSGTWTSLFF